MLSVQSKPASALSRGHPAWAKKAKHLANEFFIVRTVITQNNPQEKSLRYGIVVKKKIGGAVVRNRIKRRLRAAFCFLEKNRQHTQDSVAYILVVKQTAVAHLPFDEMCCQLQSVLKFYD